MMILVLGKNNSGKSLYAENMACSLAKGKLYYVATMLPYGEEGKMRVTKHRMQRQGKGFITMESPYADADIADNTGTVLLEDISNLVANLMFEEKSLDAEKKTLSRVKKLRESSESLIVVSISGYERTDGDNDETHAYIENFNRVNLSLWNMADVVVEMISGSPVVHKGELL